MQIIKSVYKNIFIMFEKGKQHERTEIAALLPKAKERYNDRSHPY